jgi:hypothetical protein
MSLYDPTVAAGTIEECMDEINDFVATLEHYPPSAVALAMSVHLQSILRALLECRLCTRQQVREFIHELEYDVLEVDEE